MSLYYKLEEMLHLKSYTNNKYLLKLSVMLNQKPEKMLMLFLFLGAFFFLVTELGRTLIFLGVAYAYPIFKTAKAFEKNQEKSETQKWLIYWMIFGFV